MFKLIICASNNINIVHIILTKCRFNRRQKSRNWIHHHSNWRAKSRTAKKIQSTVNESEKNMPSNTLGRKCFIIRKNLFSLSFSFSLLASHQVSKRKQVKSTYQNHFDLSSVNVKVLWFCFFFSSFPFRIDDLRFRLTLKKEQIGFFFISPSIVYDLWIRRFFLVP